MRFVTYSEQDGGSRRFGFLKEGFVVDVLRAAIWARQEHNFSEALEVPTSLKRALKNWNKHLMILNHLEELLPTDHIDSYAGHNKAIAQKEDQIHYFPPVHNPSTFRDFYAFEQHVKAARKLQGLDMNPLWYKIPIFYFSNPNTLYGHQSDIPYPKSTSELDFELELAVIIAGSGRDITREDADLFIGGYTILNNWSARDLQREEMQLNLGPSKGKDFASSIGPALVTPDELSDSRDGETLNLRMQAFVNGRQISDGNANDLYHSFQTMIEKSSENVDLLPGDLLGSGTVGSGCILELRPENTGGWIKKGDTVRLEIEKLGILENKVI